MRPITASCIVVQLIVALSAFGDSPGADELRDLAAVSSVWRGKGRVQSVTLKGLVPHSTIERLRLASVSNYKLVNVANTDDVLKGICYSEGVGSIQFFDSQITSSWSDRIAEFKQPLEITLHQCTINTDALKALPNTQVRAISITECDCLARDCLFSLARSRTIESVIIKRCDVDLPVLPQQLQSLSIGNKHRQAIKLALGNCVLRSLNLENCELTETTFDSSSLTSIEELRLVKCVGKSDLRMLTSLRRFEASRCNDMEGLQFASNEIAHFRLEEMTPSHQLIAHVLELRSLREIELVNCDLNKILWERVKPSSTLIAADLSGSRSPDPGEVIRVLSQQPLLELLACDKFNLGDADMTELSKSRTLVMLTISNNESITDASCESISAIHSLRELYIDGTSISRKGTVAIKRALPHIHIEPLR